MTAVSGGQQLRDSAASGLHTFPPGYRLGHLRLLSPLGSGGMGCVYLAVDARCGSQVAVKCLNPARRSVEFFTGLSREARLLSQLQHPNIVRLLEFNFEHDPPYLVLELAAAGSLRQALKHRILSQQQSARLVATVARAVHAAHETGVLHLDLKPENILLMRNPAHGEEASQGTVSAAGDLPWVPAVADFGLADCLHGEGHFAETWRRPRGTLAWMAPEQISGQSAQLGRATDVYALGVVLYELLTGMLPFRSSHDVELSGQICRCPPSPPRELCPGISRTLNRICLRCLQKEPGNRFQTAAELADELDSLIACSLTPRSAIRRWLRWPPRILRRPRFFILVGLQVLLALVGFVLGGVIGSRFPWPLLFVASATQVTGVSQDSIAIEAMQLAADIIEADRMIELFLLLPDSKERDNNDFRSIQLLWDAVLQPSGKLLSNPRFVHVLKNRDPPTLLLARLHEVAGLAEDGQCDAATAAWRPTVELAQELLDRKLLDERLRWRGFIAARRLDRTLTRQHHGSEGLQQLERAWTLFGPENMGPMRQTRQFTAVHADFYKYLQDRRAQSVQASETSVEP
ncbi:MAG: serine/threonine-protein kinase [Planctomycetaceae bacterium]